MITTRRLPPAFAEPWLLTAPPAGAALLRWLAGWLFGGPLLLLFCACNPFALQGQLDADRTKIVCAPGVSSALCKQATESRNNTEFVLALGRCCFGPGAALFLLALTHDGLILRRRRGQGGSLRRPVLSPVQVAQSRARWRLTYHLTSSREVQLDGLLRQLSGLAFTLAGPLTVEMQGRAGKLRLYVEGDSRAADQIVGVLMAAIPYADLTLVPPSALIDLPGLAPVPQGGRRGLHFWQAQYTFIGPLDGYLEPGILANPAEARVQQSRREHRLGALARSRRIVEKETYSRDIMTWNRHDQRESRFAPVTMTDSLASILISQPVGQVRVHFYGPETDLLGYTWQGLSLTVAAPDPTTGAVLTALLGPGLALHAVNLYSANPQHEAAALAAFLYPPTAQFKTPEPPARYAYLPVSTPHTELDRVPPFVLSFPESYRGPIRRDAGRALAAGLIFGYANERQERAIGVPLTNDLYRHGFIKGGTGTGKSYLLKLLARQAVELGMSLVVLDPHGEMVTQLYNEFDDAARARTEIIDLDSRKASIRLNLLAVQRATDPDDQAAAVDQAVSVAMRFFVLQGLSSTTSPRRYEFVQSWLGVLLSDAVNREDRDFGLLEFIKALNNQTACAAVLADLEETAAAGLQATLPAFPSAEALQTARYHANQPPADWQENSQGVARTVAEIAGNPSLAALCRPPFTDPSALLDAGGILLCALSEETGGAAVSKLFELILLGLQQSVMGRGARFGRNADHYWPTLIIIDEARHVVGDKSLRGAGPMVDAMLKDFRKYKAAVLLALQNLEDISHEIYNTLALNTATKIAFRESVEAERMARMIGPDADPAWLARLNSKEYQALITLSAEGAQMLGTIRTPAQLPLMQRNLAGRPTYQASGKAAIWRRVPAVTGRIDGAGGPPLDHETQQLP